ncbi:MAG: class I SAM-dependent methyltransferase [Lentisphaerae bacterium]|nr:class I SAM-dependent methyltransferase [Lentisphaerota bacterium]
MKRNPDRSPLITVLRWTSYLLPGDFLKTFFYLHCVAAPRRILHKLTSSFYRMDPLYQVLSEFKRDFNGPFSILEFGTASGYSSAKMLYATRYLHMEDDVVIHAFDSFQGLPPVPGKEDKGIVSSDWQEGQYRGDYERLCAYVESKGYKNHRIHKGYFEETLTPELLEEIKPTRPIFVWVDCDYYEGTRHLFEWLLPILPSGCVFYFDDFEFNYGSRLTGEARLVHEVNQGAFGDNVELMHDRSLSLDSDRVYRFMRLADDQVRYDRKPSPAWEGTPRPIGNGSPLP